MTVQIVEVVRRSQQGVTRPFICLGDDGEVYFVKGTGAGRKSQMAEWIAGKLALALGLPIAPFEIVEVPEELIEPDSRLELNELGAGPAFGSLRQEVMELASSAILDVPDQLQRDVLAFDWWIRNEDRLLTARGGNPNLFWHPDSHELVVIDHNQAFDADFDPENFLDNHVFAGCQRQVFSDMHRRPEYNERFAAALDGWQKIQETIPPEWLFADLEKTVPTDFDLDWAYELLARHVCDDFWNTP